MAFGEKQRRIDELQGQVANLETRAGDLEAELVGIQPWVGLAQTIRDKNNEYAATMDLDTAVGLAIHDAAEEQRQALIMAAFGRLDPEKQLEMLVTTFGDGVLKEALEAERQRRLSLTDSDLAIDLLVKEAREFRRFRPSDLPKDAKVELFLYRKGSLDGYVEQDIKIPDPRGKTSANWARHIRGIAMGDGDIAVHNDTMHNIVPSNQHLYAYADHQTMSLQAPADDAHEQPLYFNVGVRIPEPADTTRHLSMDLDLGPVFVNDIDIFGVTKQATQQEG